MKSIFYLRLFLINVLILTVFLNCENNDVGLSDSQNNLQENIYEEKKTDIDENQFTDYQDALNGIVEDKDNYFKMNNLELLSFKLVKNKERIIPDFHSSNTVKLQRKSVDNLDLINDFDIKSFNNSDESNSDYIEKKEKYIFKLINEEIDLQVIDLKWRWKNEIISTQAYFRKNEFLYDDIISNYLILKSQKITSKEKKSNSLYSKTETPEDDYYDCIAIIGRKPITYYTSLSRSLTSYFGGNVAEAKAEITVNGSRFVQNGSCKNVIESYTSHPYGYQTATGIADAKVKIVNFRAYSPYQQYEGHCEYMMAVVLQYKSPWEDVTVTLSSGGTSFSVSGGGTGTRVFEQKGGLITASMLH